MKAAVFFALCGLVVLSGCGANFHSIYRHEPVAPPSVTTVDAKQRAILAAAPKSLNGDKEYLRFCAEPSPDVFSVIAQSISGGASFGQSADPKTVQAALNAAFSASEQGSTIPRTQTTNMLREVMYRTCERYLSGGISDVELSLQAVRDQRLIVSILAIEQLTGAVTPKPVVIGASSNGSSGSSGNDATVRLDDQNKVAQKAAEALKKKQDAFSKLNGDTKDCDVITKAVADKKEDDLSQGLKDKRLDCDAASAELGAAKQDKAAADAHYKALNNAISNGGIPVVVGGSLMAPVAGGGLDTSGHSSDIAQVALTVKDIVISTFKQDEFLFLCLKVLNDQDKGKLGQLSENCLSYIKSKVALEEERNISSAEEITAAKKVIQVQVDESFNKFWALVSTGGQFDQSKFDSLKKKIGPKIWPECFDGENTKTGLNSCFNSLIANKKRALSKGGS
jgi:hypothetical protein